MMCTKRMKDQGYLTGEEDVSDTMIMYLRRCPIETRLRMPSAVSETIWYHYHLGPVSPAIQWEEKGTWSHIDQPFPGGSDDKASAYSAGDLDLIPGSGRSSGEGNGNPLQYSCLENPMDGGAGWATVHGVTKSRTRLSDFTSLHFIWCPT